MEDELKKVLGVLDIEVFYEGPEIIYGWLYRAEGGYRHPNPDLVKRQFGQLLKSRELSTDEFYDLTEINFDDKESLYDYLGQVYEYLFEGKYQDDPPHPPVDDDE